MFFRLNVFIIRMIGGLDMAATMNAAVEAIIIIIIGRMRMKSIISISQVSYVVSGGDVTVVCRILTNFKSQVFSISG